MKTSRTVWIAIGTLLAGTACAGPGHWNGSRSAPMHSDYDYAPVTRVEPIVRQVRVQSPRQECWDEVRYVQNRAHISDPAVGGRTLLGSVIGGVIGHQFGSGRGRDAATVAGAAIGAGVGYDSAAKRQPQVREEVVRRCDVRHQSQYEQRVEGYRVSYEYLGRSYTTEMPYDPGNRIRVRVAVAAAP